MPNPSTGRSATTTAAPTNRLGKVIVSEASNCFQPRAATGAQPGGGMACALHLRDRPPPLRSAGCRRSHEDLADSRGPPPTPAMSSRDSFIVQRCGDGCERQAGIPLQDDPRDDRRIEPHRTSATRPWIQKVLGKRRGGQSDHTRRRSALADHWTQAPVDGVQAHPNELRRFAPRHQPHRLKQ
jgi:hypothetical protein